MHARAPQWEGLLCSALLARRPIGIIIMGETNLNNNFGGRFCFAGSSCSLFSPSLSCQRPETHRHRSNLPFKDQLLQCQENPRATTVFPFWLLNESVSLSVSPIPSFFLSLSLPTLSKGQIGNEDPPPAANSGIFNKQFSHPLISTPRSFFHFTHSKI